MRHVLISIFLFPMLLLTGSTLKAQVCGIRAGAHILNYEVNGPEFQYPYQALTVNTRWIVVRDSEGNGINELSMIEEAIDEVKSEFALLGIRLVATCDYTNDEIIEITIMNYMDH